MPRPRAAERWTAKGPPEGRMRHLVVSGIALLAWVVEPAAAATLVEMGDAGDLPSTAQSSEGVQPFGTPLDAITGTIASASDQDMFEIFIDDPANFSASTNNAGTNLSADDDTMLFLFRANGLGGLANDDTSGSNLTSTIPAGSLSGLPAGIYFIAVSIFFNTPTSALGEIFDVPEQGVVGPNGPGGSLPITGWDLFPDPAQTGPYRIDLTGSTFVPEPSTALLLGVGCAALATRSRRGVRRGRPL